VRLPVTVYGILPHVVKQLPDATPEQQRVVCEKISKQIDSSIDLIVEISRDLLKSHPNASPPQIAGYIDDIVDGM